MSILRPGFFKHLPLLVCRFRQVEAVKQALHHLRALLGDWLIVGVEA